MNKKLTSLFLASFLLFASLGLSAQKMMHAKHYRPHFVYSTALGVNAGVGTLHYDKRTLANHIPLFHASQLLAYQFNPYLTAGVEMGLDLWKKTAFIPVLANITVDFTTTKIIPTWYANVGYAFKWYMPPKPEKMTQVVHGARSGIHFNTGLGVKIHVAERLQLLVAADYRLQRTTLQYSVEEATQEFDYSQVITNRTENKLYHFIGVRVGIIYW